MSKKKKTKQKSKKEIGLSVIIVSFQNASILDLCLKSILEEVQRIKTKNNSDSEIIVVDSLAGEKTRDVVKKYILEDFPVKYFPFKENVGFSKAVNKGILESKGSNLLILNADIIATQNSILKMLNYLEKNPDIGVMGPKLLNFDGSPQSSVFKFYTPSLILYRRTFLGKTPWGKKVLNDFVIKIRHPQKAVSVNGWLMGSALMLRKENLAKVGPMDERYFMYFEDVDWCRRFKESGFKIVYFPNASLFHYHGKQSATRHSWELIFNRMTLVHISSAVKYFWKFGIK